MLKLLTCRQVIVEASKFQEPLIQVKKAEFRQITVLALTNFLA